jgi:hypothetical protein
MMCISFNHISAKFDKVYEPLIGPGIATLGQEADSLGGGYDGTQSFSGAITEFNIWDKVLKSKEIVELYDCSSDQIGNVLSMTNPLNNSWNISESRIQLVSPIFF